MARLRGIGYWADNRVADDHPEGRGELASQLDLPDPMRLVEALGARQADERVLSYLRTGHVYVAYLGYSHCRFECGIPDIETGTIELTDGTWVWPEGLGHYVEAHGVPLPDAFLTTLSERQWRVPDFTQVAQAMEQEFDLGFWKSWYRTQVLSDAAI